MPRRWSIPLVAFVFALALCLPATASSDQPRWLEIHSTHFTVVTDAGEARGRDVALHFEQMRAVFGFLLSKDRLNQSIPLTILAFGNDQSYYQLAPLQQGHPIDAPGFFLAGSDQDFIALNMSESDPWRAVAKDLATMLLTYNYPPTQPWFDAGLTEYFSTIRIVDKQVEIGATPELSAAPGEKASIGQILTSQRWMPLPDLFTARIDAHAPAAQRELFNAESWIVMHYLIHEKRISDAGTYFGLYVGRHVPIEDAIKQAFGVSSAQLQQTIQDYFHSQISPGTAPKTSAAASQLDHFPVPVASGDSAITAQPMPSDDALAIYAGVQTRIPERRDLGLKTLQQLATTPTEADKKAEQKQTGKRVGEDLQQLPSNAIGNPIAHRMLAWDDIQHDEFEQAFKEIGDAASLNRGDMWVRYYLCVAKYRMAKVKHSEILGLSNMMLDLRSVLEWNPEMAEAYDLLALARNAGGIPAEAMPSERAAIALSPRNEHYTLHLAQIYVASKKWDAAGALLDRLKSSDDADIASQARDLLAQSGAERKYGIATTGVSAQPKFEPQKSPFDVLDEDAAKREATENADQANTTADKRETKYIKGRLVAVDCSKSPEAVLTLSSDQGTLKLRTTDYRSLLLIGTDSFSCDWRDRQVTANYKSSGGRDGDLVSLEMR
ncbi:MAG TPA: tetratricopeptide repeat protein [Candidatus Acidoferrales bacterium]|nr:tetratricopeptide repeat protein [Candidatus Acidoferrales bacterium]